MVISSEPQVQPVLSGQLGASVFQIRVNGTTVATTTSSDATLSALALENASDDSAITISPVFASGTTSYTADPWITAWV